MLVPVGFRWFDCMEISIIKYSFFSDGNIDSIFFFKQSYCIPVTGFFRSKSDPKYGVCQESKANEAIPSYVV